MKCKGFAVSLPSILMPTLPHLGAIHGQPAEDYFAVDALNYGGLQLMARSPGHCYALTKDERRPARVVKSGQLEGSLAHCFILEPEEVPFRYAVGPEVSRATREWKIFEAEHPRQVCIKPSQAAAASAQAGSVRGLPEMAKMLSKGHAEVSAYWHDPQTGVLCKCRPDWVHPIEGEGVILLDVKTYSDASPREFARQVGRKRYFWQAYWYSTGYAIATGVPVLGFVFCAVESDWPYAACAMMLDEEAMQLAEREIRPLVQQYAECQRSHVWPGYPKEVQQIALPYWYVERETD